MHYTGTIWRPPYEANSLLIEATAGCTHHSCKFCTLYDDIPFKFRMSPISDIEADLKEVKEAYGRFGTSKISRVFLTGANPFVLKYDYLMNIAELIHIYLPNVKSIGSFARITDITLKSDRELSLLHEAGYDGLTIGMESGDDNVLAFMNKGYTSGDIITQCGRLDKAGISYSLFLLIGMAGAGKGEESAKLTADVCNRLNPILVGPNMLTIYKNSELYNEIKLGNWKEESETEKYSEIKTLVQMLDIPAVFAALGASNAFQLYGKLPKDRNKLLNITDEIINNIGEDKLSRYRKNLKHL